MRKYYSILDTWGSGGNDPNKLPPPQPEGYRPLTVDERSQWNGFLDYLDKQKLGGSETLDQRDQSLGLKAMSAYRKANPNFTITPDRISSIQWEQYMLRKGDSFPGLKPEELAYVRKGLTRPDGTSPFLNRPVSPIDNWLGSLTSKLYYPNGTRNSNSGESWNFGVNMEDYVKSLTDPVLAEKYKVKSQ